MTEQELMYASDEDIAFFHKCTAGLPGVEGFSGTGFDAKGNQIPYGCGPHSVRCIRNIVEIVKPKSILGIGTNLCYSDAMWLELAPEAKILSLDISDKEETLRAVSIMEDRYRSRFEFLLTDSKTAFNKIKDRQFDLAFIDGDHLEDGVTSDIKTCLDLGIKYLSMDDWLPQFGPGVQPSVKKFPIKIIVVCGNITLLRTDGD